MDSKQDEEIRERFAELMKRCATCEGHCANSAVHPFFFVCFSRSPPPFPLPLTFLPPHFFSMNEDVKEIENLLQLVTKYRFGQELVNPMPSVQV